MKAKSLKILYPDIKMSWKELLSRMKFKILPGIALLSKPQNKKMHAIWSVSTTASPPTKIDSKTLTLFMKFV